MYKTILNISTNHRDFTLCTTSFLNIKKFYNLPTLYTYVFCKGLTNMWFLYCTVQTLFSKAGSVYCTIRSKSLNVTKINSHFDTVICDIWHGDIPH